MGMRAMFPGSANGTAAETLSPDELAYNRRVVGQFRAAQAVMQSWAEHLHERYGLRPGVDKVHEDGRVERPEAAPPATAPANGVGGHETWGPGEGRHEEA
jgi:hypothetical protein